MQEPHKFQAKCYEGRTAVCSWWRRHCECVMSDIAEPEYCKPNLNLTILVPSVSSDVFFMLFNKPHVTYCVWRGTCWVLGPTSLLFTVYTSRETTPATWHIPQSLQSSSHCCKDLPTC
jgi:hypothetical protein